MLKLRNASSTRPNCNFSSHFYTIDPRGTGCGIEQGLWYWWPEWLEPDTVKALKQFLGIANFYPGSSRVLWQYRSLTNGLSWFSQTIATWNTSSRQSDKIPVKQGGLCSPCVPTLRLRIGPGSRNINVDELRPFHVTISYQINLRYQTPFYHLLWWWHPSFGMSN